MFSRAAIISFLVFSGPVLAVECGITEKVSHKTKEGKRWLYGNEDGLFFTAPMAVNTDGAPTSYHPDDPGGNKGLAINTICNGANAILATGTKLNYSQCQKLIDAYREAKGSGWNAAGKPKMEFYGVAANGNVPCTIQSGKYAGYFVSTTSQAANPALGKCNQARYLDALTLPFSIYPGHANFTGRKVGSGDIVISYSPDSGVLEYGIIGDRGPPWGMSEGSVFLAKRLKKLVNDPKSRADTYKFALRIVHTLILPKANIKPPYSLESIRKEGETALKAWGGKERFEACVASVGTRP